MLRSRLIVPLALAALAAAATPPGSGPRPGFTELVSYTEDGEPADGMSNASSISAGGRYVAFHSYARNLLPGSPSMPRPQVYVRDRLTGALEWISRAHDGGTPDSNAQVPEISADGRYVLFSSRATNLTESPIEVLTTHQYVHDRVTGVTELVTRTPDGAPANAPSQNSSISGDGRRVAFGSRATNLAPGAVDTHLNCFVHDLDTKETVLVSISSDGQTANTFCWYPDLNHDGRYVVYHSQATNLVEGAGGSLNDAVFLHDLQTRQTQWVSRTWDGQRPNDGSVRASISADGRYVAFGSYATNMTPVQESIIFPYDVYVRDRQASTTERVSVTGAGMQGNGSSYVPKISADGRYVLFTTHATNLDTLPNPHIREAFVRDRLLHRTERVSVGSDGQVGNGTNGFPGTLSSDGRYVDFWTDATNLAPGTDNGEPDTFVRDRGPDLGVVGALATPQGDRVRLRGGAVFAGAPISTVGPGQLLIQDSGLEMFGSTIYTHPHEGHLLFHMRLNGMRSLRGAPLPGMQYGWSFSTASGAYEIRITQRPGSLANVPPNPTRTATELYRCETSCTRVAEIDGSAGITGTAALAALPLDLIGLSEGDRLTGIRAFIALGDRALADTVAVHELAMPSAEIPAVSLRLALAPAHFPAQQVEFGMPVALDQGRFDAVLDPTEEGGAYRAWARACLGQECAVQEIPQV